MKVILEKKYILTEKEIKKYLTKFFDIIEKNDIINYGKFEFCMSLADFNATMKDSFNVDDLLKSISWDDINNNYHMLNMIKENKKYEVSTDGFTGRICLVYYNLKGEEYEKNRTIK